MLILAVHSPFPCLSPLLEMTLVPDLDLSIRITISSEVQYVQLPVF